MNVLVVIQARLGSTRLPGKVLLPLGPDNKPVLQHVVERAQRAGYPVVVAMPMEDMEAHTPRPWKTIYGWGVETGDVLGRYHYISTLIPCYPERAPDIIVRLTADCPVLDPSLIRRAVQAIEAGHDYAGNTVNRLWPRGLDVESFTTELLQQAHKEATDPYDREHVTPWMQRWASNPYALPKTPEDALGLTSAYRWALDTHEDRKWLEQAFAAFPDPTPSQLLTLHPRFD